MHEWFELATPYLLVYLCNLEWMMAHPIDPLSPPFAELTSCSRYYIICMVDFFGLCLV